MLHLALLVLVDPGKHFDERALLYDLTIPILGKVLSCVDYTIEVYSIDEGYAPLNIQYLNLVSLDLEHDANPICVPNQIQLIELRLLVLSCI